jgi:hypothetical protein
VASCDGLVQGRTVGQKHSQRIELMASEPSQLESMQRLLEEAVPGLDATRIAGRPRPGEQGALDVLALVASSSGIVTAIKVLPEFLRSRKTGLSITAMIKGEPFTLTATNIDEVMPLLERLLDD